MHAHEPGSLADPAIAEPLSRAVGRAPDLAHRVAAGVGVAQKWASKFRESL
jgi:hypothetical protein